MGRGVCTGNASRQASNSAWHAGGHQCSSARHAAAVAAFSGADNGRTRGKKSNMRLERLTDNAEPEEKQRSAGPLPAAGRDTQPSGQATAAFSQAAGDKASGVTEKQMQHQRSNR